MFAEQLLMMAVFAQVALTLWAMLRLGRARIRSIKAKETRLSDVAIDTAAYPADVRLFERNLRNQFETPVLFFAAAAFAVALGITNWVIGLAAAGYVLTRFIHRAIHVGRNNLGQRFSIFVLGLLCLLIMWGAIALSYFGSIG